jgi:hypothetical protein
MLELCRHWWNEVTISSQYLPACLTVAFVDTFPSNEMSDYSIDANFSPRLLPSDFSKFQFRLYELL